jgi:hypothetical protein
VQAYGKFVQEHVDLGWDGYWVTFMFRNISRFEERKIEQMHKEICRVYQKLLLELFENPGQKNGFTCFLRASSFLMYQGSKKANLRLERCQSTTEFMCMGSW